MSQVEGEIIKPSSVLVSPGAGASARFATLLGSHTLIDILPMFVTMLLWPLQERLNLQSWQVTVLIMAQPIASGMLQPFTAYLTDKHDTRMFAPLGLAIGAVCLCSIGLATSFWELMALQLVGVFATGMYHPIATAMAGQFGSRLLRNGRAQAIGVFICAGMVGSAIGAVVGPGVNTRWGMERLTWLIPPLLVGAVAMHVVLRHVRHRHANHGDMHAAFSAGERALRWRIVGVLTLQNAIRFIVNIGLVSVMFNVWAKAQVLREKAAAAVGGGVEPAALLHDPAQAKSIAEAASIHAGHMSVALTVGMGVGVLMMGRVVKAGRERWPLMYLSIIGAAFTAPLGWVGDMAVERGGIGGAGFLAMLPMYFCVAMTAFGFFATFPIATSLAQRLQPGHTSLVTSLMMGVGWGIGALAAPLAVLFFGMTPIVEAPALEPARINAGFYGFAALLLLAGLSTLLIPRDLVEKAAEHH